MRPITVTHKISKAELESIQIPDGTNNVLVHVPHRNENTQTKSGLYVVGDQDYKPHLHAERWGYIYKLPPSLVYGQGREETMDWETTIEAEVGDTVWFGFRYAIYAKTYECDGDWYKVIPYSELHVVKRDGVVIPLNGYILFEDYIPEMESKFQIVSNPDKGYGIARYVGTENTDYILDVWKDNIEVNEGDHVLFENNTSCWKLEEPFHATFSETTYFVQHRKRVLAVIDDEHREILRIKPGVVGVEVKKEITRASGVILLTKNTQSFDTGTCTVSSSDHVKVGDTVVVPKKSGVEFNGTIYFTEEIIYYYESL
jgi:co-chaperonin GroES (HSP10)